MACVVILCRYSALVAPLYLLGVWDCQAQAWAPWDQVVAVAEMLQMPTVPLLFRGVGCTAYWAGGGRRRVWLTGSGRRRGRVGKGGEEELRPSILIRGQGEERAED